ncbi:hypothetical protein DB88DRAFT_548888 [Papiliotrema laurentii]|uniref:Uncharacterized protein n=1 Tax=Papiliotrema laurentii TaxID=5418 RepID=A0AAD9FIJ2_PAPLA|nr:hypothetical protein DB88DRAFT_548888 [Papiliotrema laurentii]
MSHDWSTRCCGANHRGHFPTAGDGGMACFVLSFRCIRPLTFAGVLTGGILWYTRTYKWLQFRGICIRIFGCGPNYVCSNDPNDAVLVFSILPHIPGGAFLVQGLTVASAWPLTSRGRRGAGGFLDQATIHKVYGSIVVARITEPLELAIKSEPFHRSGDVPGNRLQAVLPTLILSVTPLLFHFFMRGYQLHKRHNVIEDEVVHIGGEPATPRAKSTSVSNAAWLPVCDCPSRRGSCIINSTFSRHVDAARCRDRYGENTGTVTSPVLSALKAGGLDRSQICTDFRFQCGATVLTSEVDGIKRMATKEATVGVSPREASAPNKIPMKPEDGHQEQQVESTQITVLPPLLNTYVTLNCNGIEG